MKLEIWIWERYLYFRFGPHRAIKERLDSFLLAEVISSGSGLRHGRHRFRNHGPGEEVDGRSKKVRLVAEAPVTEWNVENRLTKSAPGAYKISERLKQIQEPHQPPPWVSPHKSRSGIKGCNAPALKILCVRHYGTILAMSTGYSQADGWNG